MHWPAIRGPRAGVGRFVGGLNYALRPAQRRRDLANLRLALPGRPEAELPVIARESLCDASVGALEFLQMVDGTIDAAQFLGPVTAHGREHLDRALAGGRGVLGVGLHLGHFGKVPLWLAQAGYPVTIVIREARQVPPGYYIEALQRLGLEAIRIERDQAAAPRVLDALRRGRVVMIYLDQGVKNDGGIQIEFLGKRVPMPAGPLVLARRARAPIVPVFLHPELHEVVIHPPLPAPAGIAARGRPDPADPVSPGGGRNPRPPGLLAMALPALGTELTGAPRRFRTDCARCRHRPAARRRWWQTPVG